MKEKSKDFFFETWNIIKKFDKYKSLSIDKKLKLLSITKSFLYQSPLMDDKTPEDYSKIIISSKASFLFKSIGRQKRKRTNIELNKIRRDRLQNLIYNVIPHYSSGYNHINTIRADIRASTGSNMFSRRECSSVIRWMLINDDRVLSITSRAGLPFKYARSG